jgi:hypothetical protein
MAKFVEAYVETTTKRYGHAVIEQHPMVKITDGKMTVDGKEVVDYVPEIFQGLIPQRLIAHRRAEDSTGRGARFICGVDLMEDGRIWNSISRGLFQTSEECFDEIRRNEGVEDFILFVEEAFEIPS